MTSIIKVNEIQDAGGNTILSSNGTGTFTTNFTTGKVLQVLSATKTDTFSTASTSYVDVTDLSISITPASTSNKILIMFYGQGSTSSTDTGQIRLDRSGTDIFIGDASGNRQQCTVSLTQGEGSKMRNVSFNYLDSPSTTSATTYKIQLRANSGTAYLGRTLVDGDATGYPRTPCEFIAMEISG